MKIEFCCEEMANEMGHREHRYFTRKGLWENFSRTYLPQCPYCNSKIEITVKDK